MLSNATKAEIVSWLQTLSPPKNIASNPEAAKLESELLLGVFDRAGIKPQEVRDVFRVIKETAETRSWPTSKELLAAIAAARGLSPEADPTRGDKRTLSHDQLALLENKILPTARRWLGIPGLAEHGAKTLAFWGETFDMPAHLVRRMEAAE
jgi:hypothetical protein